MDKGGIVKMDQKKKVGEEELTTEHREIASMFRKPHGTSALSGATLRKWRSMQLEDVAKTSERNR